MNRTSIFAVLAAVLMLGLSACGGTAPQPVSSSASEAVSVQAPAEEQEAPAPQEETETEEPEASAADSAAEPSAVETEPAVEEASDDDIVLGDTSMGSGETQTLSLQADGLSPIYESLADTSLATTGNIGKNIYYAAAIVDSTGLSQGSNPDLADSGEITETAAADVVIRNRNSGTNGLLINGVPYAVTGADIVLDSIDNGQNTSDFIGKGTALMATGAAANVTVEDSSIDVTGVGRLAAFVDAGATMTVKNSSLTSRGGTLYESYRNTAGMNVMVSPPWVLGIMGNSRCTNLMGTNSTLNLIGSHTASGAWAGLSTDAGTNVHLNVFDTDVTLLHADESQIPFQAQGGQLENLDNPFTTRYGAGYGAYTIGAAVETFRGADIRVGTMANIFTGGAATYGALKAGETYTLESGSGETDLEYTAEEDRITVIDSDTQGFMIHQNANTLNVLEGTEVNSAFTTVLMKTGASGASMDAVFDDAHLNTGNGVLVQLMDNDDSLLGGMDASGGFYETYTETPGFPAAPETADGTLASETADMGPGSVPSTGAETGNFTFRNMELQGNLYNAGGWYGGLKGIPMNISLEDATLDGAIATTSAIHVTYDGAMAYKDRKGVAFDDEDEAAQFAEQYQAAEFSISQYWIIGQVANKIAYSGSNPINVTLSGDSVWNVESTSMINSLTISDSAKVVVPKDVTLTINGTDYTDCVLDQAQVYGEVALPGEADESSGGFGGPGGPPPGGPGGPPPGGPGGPPPGMGGEAQSETEPAVTMLWSLADPDLAELHDNGDGTASVTATAAGTVRVYVDVVVDGVSAGRFTKIITVE